MEHLVLLWLLVMVSLFVLLLASLVFWARGVLDQWLAGKKK